MVRKMYSEKLINLREEYELKQYEVAKLLNIYKGTYNQYETEYNIMPLKHLIKICDYFNISLDYIFNFTNIKSYKDISKGIDKNKLKVRLKELRIQENLTQAQLANTLNVATSVIAGAEQGRRIIATPFLYSLGKEYKISVDYLLGRIDKPKYLK